MTAALLSLLTFVSTALGGLFALQRRRHSYAIIGCAAGVLIGAALLDLLPEAIELVRGAADTSISKVFLAALAAGSFLFVGTGHLLPEAEKEAASAAKLYASIVAGIGFVLLTTQLLRIGSASRP